LGHAFRKLGVDNRVQLVERLSTLKPDENHKGARN